MLHLVLVHHGSLRLLV
jgi:hypothetical protein